MSSLNSDTITLQTDTPTEQELPIIVNSGETVDIISGDFADITSSNDGGVILNKGTVNLINAEFTNNTSAGNAGAIDNDGTINNITANFTGNSATLNGGAITNYKSSTTYDGHIKNITGNFTNNSAGQQGGAIYNSNTITAIEGNFTTNNIHGTNDAFGGALANYGSIGSEDKNTLYSINGNFTGNYAAKTAENGSGNALGGAIYNSGYITGINGDFERNYVEGKASYGGAIYNTKSSSVIKNLNSNFTKNHAGMYGGAIYNYNIINNITGDFERNYVDSTQMGSGGAISNLGTIDNLNSSFTSNSATAQSYAYGGAIRNLGTIGAAAEDETVTGKITGNFISNYVHSLNNTAASEAAVGGAIYNIGNITGIEGNFEGNYSHAVNGLAYAGALFNRTGNIGNIIGDFTGNYAISDNHDVYGGAIYNGSRDINTENPSIINLIKGNFTENYGSAKGSVYGGVIRNNSIINKIDGDFLRNYATGSSAYGGAIANSYTIGNLDSNFEGNYISTNFSDDKTGTFQGGTLYNSGTVSNLNGNFTGNYIKNELYTNSLNLLGGAIYNSGTIGTKDADGNITGKIKGNFSGNYISSLPTNDTSSNISGGAIYNTGTIIAIEGDFTENYAESTLGLAVRGGAIANNSGKIENITGNFESNHVNAAKCDAGGGAIWNQDAEISSLNSNFTGNTVSSAYGYGGAIFNKTMTADSVTKGKISTINGNFTNNSVAGTNLARGGAIYNFSNATIENITAETFTGNHADSAAGQAQGGAILNMGSIGNLNANFTGNYAKTEDEDSHARGGAIYNDATITTITSDFTNNYVEGKYARGGAIHNTGTIQTLNSNFTGNSVKVSTGGSYQGGAIFNGGTINVVNGNFQNNTAAAGGAILNWDSGNISELNSDFISNYTTGSGGAVYNTDENTVIGTITGTFRDNHSRTQGGAISNVNNATITNIESLFDSNYISASVNAQGGAIYNDNANINNLNANFTGNNAVSTGANAQGGAIYNTGSLGTLTNLTFTGNYAKGTTAEGGAIWTNQDLNIKADNGTAKFEGNYIQAGESDKVYDAIHIGAANKTLNLGAYNSGKILFYDNINGENGYTLTLNGDDSGKIDLTGLVQNASSVTLNTTHLTFAENTFNSDGLIFTTESGFVELQDNEFKTYTIDKLNHQNTTWNIDIDLLNQKSDVIKTNKASSGSIYIDQVSLDGIEIIDGVHKVQILDTQTSDLQLSLNAELTGKNILKTEHVDGPAVITNDVIWNHKFYDGHFDYTTYGQLGLATSNTLNDSIAYTIWTDLTGEDYTLTGDTLTLWNTKIPGDEAVKNFNFASAKDVYIATDNVGISGGSVLNINGVANGEEKSTIDLDSHTGFVLNEGTTLNINNTAFTNSIDSTGSIVDITEGAIANLNGVTQEAISNNALIKNDGTLNFTGNMSHINTNISGTGTMNVNTHVKMFENETTAGRPSITQEIINVNNGGTLEVYGHGKIYSDLVIATGGNTIVSADGITADVTNNGTLDFYNGTLEHTINGSGTTGIMQGSTVANNAAINQAVSVSTGAILNVNANIGSAAGLISNSGTINTNADNLKGRVDNSNVLNISGGTVNNEIFGTGSTTITSNLTNQAGIKQATTINNGVTLTNNAALGSDTGIITNSGTIISSATNIKGNVTNNNNLTLNGGELNKTVSGEGNTNITGNVTSNASISQNINITGALTSNASNIGGVVDNDGDLNLNGGTLSQTVSGDGNTNITGNVTSNALISQNINITGALTSNASNIGGVVDNDGDLTLNGGTLSHNVSGEGKTNITGEVTNNSKIQQNVEISTSGNLTNNNLIGNVVNKGILTSDAGNLTGTIENNKTLNLSGTIGKEITGQGTTYVQNSLTLVNGADIKGTVNAASGALISVSGDENAQYSIGKLTGDGDINVTGGNFTIKNNANLHNLTNSGNTIIEGNLAATGNIVNENTLTINGNTTAQNVTNNGDMDVLGSLIVSEIITNTGDLDVFGVAKAKEIINTGNLTVQNNATVDITGNLTTTENITTSGNLWVIGSINAQNLTNDGELTVGNNVTVNSFINNKTTEISGNVTVNGVGIDGKTSFANDGSATIGGILTASGNISNKNSLIVDGQVNAQDILNDTNATLEFKQGAQVQDFINKGAAKITGDLSANEIQNDKKLNISGNVTASGNITSSDELTVGQDLTTEGDITNSGNMTIAGNVSAKNLTNILKAEIGGTLTTTGNISNSKELTVNGKVKAQDITNNSDSILTFKQGADVQNLTNDGTAIINGILNANENILNNNELTVKDKVTAQTVNNTKTLNFNKGAELQQLTNSGTANILNGLNASEVINSSELNLNAGNIDINNIRNTSVINITNNADAFLNNSITGEGGNINITDSTFTTNGNIRNQNITATNSTINLGGNSEILKSSVLNVNSSHIYTIDNHYTNYILDELNSSADSRYHIDINLSREEQKSDTFTLTNGGSGKIYLSSINVINNCQDNDKFRLQIIKSGTDNAPQLDYDKSKVLDQANANMSNDMIIAKEFGLYTTDTINDTLEIRGWRDVFGEWSEFETDENKTFSFVNDDKFTLTRDVMEFNGEKATITGQGNTFNSNNFNWYATINEDQTISISNLNIINNKGEMNNKGHLILDNVYHDKDIQNNNILDLNNNIALEKVTNNAQLTHKGDKIAINDFINKGSATIDANNTVINKLTNNKDINITGNLNAQDIKNSGDINIVGNTTISKLNNDKNFTVTGNFIAENIANNSELNVNKSTFNTGKITAKTTGNLNIKDSTFNAFGNVEKQNISAVNSTINVINPYFLVKDSVSMTDSTMNLGALTLKPLHFDKIELNNSTINIPSSQVDFVSGTMGRLSIDSGNVDKDSVINLNLLNNINVPTKETTFVKMQFADTSISHNVSYNGQDTIYAPIYRYGVSYNPEDGNMFFVRGGRFNPETGKIDRPVNPSDQFNPAILSTSTAAHTAASSIMNQTYNYVFQNSDNFMASPLKERLAVIYKNKYALNDSLLLSDSLAGMNTEASTWYKPFANFETVQYKEGPKAHTTVYGTLAGFDSSIKPLKNGWARTYTGYIGYNGATQSFGGVHSTQNGGLIGGIVTLYKGNFFSATTLSAGATVAETNSMYGHDDTTMLIGGAANKTGYNFEFKDGKYIIQPNLLVSYTFVNTFDYTNAAGVKISSDPLHAIQVSPGFKMMANTKNDWQPYIAVNMVMNFLDKSRVTADTVRLPGMTTRPYVQYGIGIQKTFKDNFMAFGQTMFQSGGRHGISLTAGLRWTFGNNHENNNEQKVNNIKQAPIPTVKPKSNEIKVNNKKPVQKETIKQPEKQQYEKTPAGKTIIKQLSQTYNHNKISTTKTTSQGILKQIY